MVSPAVRLLETMWRIRAFEEKVSELVAAGEIPGLVHLSIGQEASAAGVCDLLQDGDVVYTGHRAHGHFLARGSDPRRMLAELMGRRDGLCRGKGGSMHLVDVSRGLLGATGVVGGNIPLALGTALAQAERGSGAITVVFFGDGAVQTGYFHESLNIAALWELPLLLVCENNGYAEFTPRSAHTPVERVTRHAETYGMANATVDGNDALAVRDAASSLVARLRANGGPALLECLTYRLRGHYEGDPARYREATEVAEWKSKDPIVRLVRAASLGERDVRAAEQKAQSAIEEALVFARSSPYPDASELTEHVYG